MIPIGSALVELELDGDGAATPKPEMPRRPPSRRQRWRPLNQIRPGRLRRRPPRSSPAWPGMPHSLPLPPAGVPMNSASDYNSSPAPARTGALHRRIWRISSRAANPLRPQRRARAEHRHHGNQNHRSAPQNRGKNAGVEAPHPAFRLYRGIRPDRARSLAQGLNDNRTAEQPKLTVLPFLMRALVKLIPKFPQVNAHYDEEAGILRNLRRHSSRHRYANRRGLDGSGRAPCRNP